MHQSLKEQQLQAFYKDLAGAAEAGDKAAYADMFLPNAAIFLPHRPPLQGREQIGDWFEEFRNAFVLVLDIFEQEQIDIVGDVAMVRSRSVGHYLVKSTGEKVSLDQKYLDVLRCEDGAWRMAYHIASSTTFEPGLWERDWEKW